jgi:ABC-type uncharacterized transport system involved in gliding motility auxiliary subunit
MTKKKLWKYLFWFGPFLFVAGLTSGLVTSWGLVPTALLISGLVIVGVWLIWQSQQNKWWKRRSTQAGTNALVATLAVLVILGLINFLGDRYHFRKDLTENQLFTLAPQSKELVRSLQQPIKLWVFDANQNLQDRELLENYQRQSPKFKFEYVDPQARPGLADKFGVKDYGEVYLESPSQNKPQLVQVVNENERLSEIRLTNRLQQIVSDRIAKVYLLQGHGEHQLSGGEGAMSQAVQTLGEKNFTTEPLNLVEKSAVPDDASVVVVAGAKRALFDAEVQALRDYLKRGGNLLLMLDPDSDTKLESLLQEWGVKLDNRLAIDVSGEAVGLGPAVALITEYGKHPITKDFGNSISFYRLARPIEITPVAGIQATPLLLTKPYPNSWAESDQKSEKLEFNADKDLKGPLTLGVALSKKLTAQSQAKANPIPSPSPTPTTKPSPTTQTKASPTPTPTAKASPTTQAKATPTPTAKASPTSQTKASPTPSPSSTPLPTNLPATLASPTPVASPTPIASPTPVESPAPITPPSPVPVKTESRLVVLGNSDFATDGLFTQQLNGDVFLNSVTWLSQQDGQPLSIRPKEAKNRRINLTGAQANLLMLSSLLVLPLIAFAVAALLWWQRR